MVFILLFCSQNYCKCHRRMLTARVETKGAEIKESQANRPSKLRAPALNICGSSVWNLLHVGPLAPETLRLLLDFLKKICAPLIYRVNILSDKYRTSLPAAIPPYMRAAGYNKRPDLVNSTSSSPWNFHQPPRMLQMSSTPRHNFHQPPRMLQMSSTRRHNFHQFPRMLQMSSTPRHNFHQFPRMLQMSSTPRHNFHQFPRMPQMSSTPRHNFHKHLNVLQLSNTKTQI